MAEVMSGMAIVRHSSGVLRPGHDWWAPLRLAYVPGCEHPVLEEVLPAFLEHLRQTGHDVRPAPDEATNLMMTTARFGEPVPWRQALMLSHRRSFRLTHSPSVITLVLITPAELE